PRFLNDKWDLSSRLSFNLGARYDKFHDVDATGALVGNDSKLSPRLGIMYDVTGNGRIRANASYSRYVSRVQEGVESNTTVAGTPAIFEYAYNGPDFTGT